jgi:hypothetical protein
MSWAGTHAPALRPAGGRRIRTRLAGRIIFPCPAAPPPARGQHGVPPRGSPDLGSAPPHRTARDNILPRDHISSVVSSGYRTRTNQPARWIDPSVIGATRPATPAPDPSKARGPCPGEQERRRPDRRRLRLVRNACGVPTAEPMDAMAQCQRHTDPSSDQTVLTLLRISTV